MLSVRLKRKLTIYLVLALFVLAGLYSLLITVNNWFNDNQFIFQAPIQITLQKPIQIIKRELLRPTIIEVVNELPELKDLTPIEEYICNEEHWGLLNCRLALAVFKMESGLRCDAWNVNSNGTFDAGIGQTNSIWFDGNYTPADAFDCYKNIDKSYEIWDRADGTIGNKQGKFTPWTVFKNGSFKENL